MVKQVVLRRCCYARFGLNEGGADKKVGPLAVQLFAAVSLCVQSLDICSSELTDYARLARGVSKWIANKLKRDFIVSGSM